METYGGCSKRPCHQYSVIGLSFESEDSPSEGQLCLYLIGSMQVAFQTMGGSQIIYGYHYWIYSYVTLQSTQYGSLGHGGIFGSVKAVSQGIPGAWFGCREIGHQFREYPRCKLVVQEKLVYVP